MQLLNEIASNPLITLLGLSLGVLGIALAIIFYLKSQRISKLRYDLYSHSLVEGLSTALDDLEVIYKGEKQDRITVTRFVFWNAGTETIRKNDLTNDIFRIACSPEIKILDQKIVTIAKVTNEISLCSLLTDEEDCSIPVIFDYLDTHDGAVIQIVHNGHVSNRFVLKGSIKGNCSIKRAESPAYRIKRRYQFLLGPFDPLMTSSLFGWIGALTYLVLGFVGFMIPILGKGSWWFLVLAVFGGFGAWVMIYAYVLGQVPSRFQRSLSEHPRSG